MDRNSISKSSESNNPIDEPELVHSVAKHEAIELSGEAKAMGNEPYTVSEATCMSTKGTSVLKSEANVTKFTEEEFRRMVEQLRGHDFEKKLDLGPPSVFQLMINAVSAWIKPTPPPPPPSNTFW
uniref:Uncharacterized protein LOC111103478 n=1 Tax=Crassostrea virginica TaxID=6565 RepID=A0A8B8AN42_CRAVI|nr:uncharacterized protein LOC111103478 [Crassostrea virginica]